MRTQNSQALSDKLVAARQRYIRTRDEVIEAAVARRAAIGESISDLQTEDAALASVQAEAQDG